MVRLHEGLNVKNHRICLVLALIVGLGGLIRCARGGGPQASRDLKSLKVLYVGDPDDERGRAITGFLRRHVRRVDEAARRGFDPASADACDVVVLDWPQGEKFPPSACPLGAREKWGRPTLLLGSAGLNLAVAWKLKGGSGCTCMEPIAYGLRAHEIFDAPFHIDREPLVGIRTPPDFSAEISASTIRVLPLVDDRELNWRPGWCTYDYDFARHPDVEYFCGGVNRKTPTAAGLWRQGNLLHFGFEQSPAEMNEVGRNLLLNSVAYVSRFSQDRPIAITPSPFAGAAPPSRAGVIRRLKIADYPLSFTQEALAPAVWNHIKDKSRLEMITWADAESQWLHPNADNLLEIDSDLKAIGVTFDDPTFPDTVVHLLGGTPEQRARGRLLASRYLPDLVKTDAAVPEGDSATAWLAENHAYLFASDSGDYRWYIDPLAKKRQIPWRELLGSRRADLADPG